jgi:RNA polymerase sigma-70 factor (ECF subfamily)
VSPRPSSERDAGGSDTSDRELLGQIARGSEPALEALYRRHEQRVFRYVAGLLRGDLDRAADVTCETFYEVWRGAKDYRGDSAATTWFLGIARFKTLSLLRRARPTEGEEALANLPADSRDPLEAIDASQRAGHVRRALDSLSPEHREVLELAIYHELPYPRIAELVGCPLNTVKTRAFYARRHLQQLLAETFHELT